MCHLTNLPLGRADARDFDFGVWLAVAVLLVKALAATLLENGDARVLFFANDLRADFGTGNERMTDGEVLPIPEQQHFGELDGPPPFPWQLPKPNPVSSLNRV